MSDNQEPKKNYSGKDEPIEEVTEDSGVVSALHVVFNTKTHEWGVIGAPGFLDDKNRAYFALMMAQKNLDEYYRKKESITNRIHTSINNFNNKINFRNFTRRK